MTYYDRSNYGYNMNNMRTGVREIGTRVRNRVSDAATTLGNRYEAYQQEQSEKAGDNPLLHVGLVPATVGLFGGIKLLDMANNRQLRKEDAAMFAEALRNAGVHDPAEISRLTKLRADLAAKGVNSDLHATELAARGQLAEADRGILSAGEAQMKKLQEMKTALGTEAAGAGMKAVSSLDVNERRFVEDFMRRTKTPDAGNLNEYMQKMLRDPNITPEQKQMIANVSGKLKADPGSVFRTMEALGTETGAVPARAERLMAMKPTRVAPGITRPPLLGNYGRATAEKGLAQVGKLGIETYKPGPLRKLLGWGAKLFGKRASITPEFAMQKLADVPRIQSLSGHSFNRMLDGLQRNIASQSVTVKQDLAADQGREKIFSDIEKSTGKPFDMDRDAKEYVKRVGGPITQSVFDHMVRRGGNRGLDIGPNRSYMTEQQENQAAKLLSEKGLDYTTGDLRWDVGMQAFRTDPNIKNRVGAYYDPKTGKIGELYPLGIADREMQRLRPQAIQGREGTLEDVFNRRLMWRDAKNLVRRVGEGVGSGATIGGGFGGFAGFVPGAIVGALGGVGLANAENARNAANYDVRTKADPNKRNIPIASGLFDFAKWTRPVYAGVSEVGGALANAGERMIAGDDGTMERTLPEQAYYAAKPHVLRGFGRGEEDKR